MRNTMTRNIVSVGVLIIILIGLQMVRGPRHARNTSNYAPVAVSPSVMKTESFSYDGKEGIDALTLLKEQVPVQQDASGMISSINGRKADDGKHEYWAFYVNGKLASVGPADYVTQDTDKIEWKIEKY